MLLVVAFVSVAMLYIGMEATMITSKWLYILYGLDVVAIFQLHQKSRFSSLYEADILKFWLPIGCPGHFRTLNSEL
jgi:hypothetical protein